VNSVHELSIAMSIVEIGEELSAQYSGSRIQRVHVRIGPMSGVSREALLFSYPFACEGTRMEGSSLLIDELSEGDTLEITALEIEE
jgi:hydrogenase nickel incorporation protein HypA/HybF